MAFSGIVFLIRIVALSYFRRTDTTKRATTIDVTVDGSAQNVDIREAGHRTGRGAIVLLIDIVRFTSYTVGSILNMGTVGLSIAVEVELVLFDTRTAAEDITTVQPQRIIKV